MIFWPKRAGRARVTPHVDRATPYEPDIAFGLKWSKMVENGQTWAHGSKMAEKRQKMEKVVEIA